MFDKIKDILGIEGLRLTIVCPEAVSRKDKSILGKVLLTSKSAKTVKALNFKIIEKYRRGRNESALIDEYILSEMDIDLDVLIDEENPAKLDFDLPLKLLKSDMDQYEESNFMSRGLVKIAKRLKNVKSDYRIEVKATVEGLSLGAIGKQRIKLK